MIKNVLKAKLKNGKAIEVSQASFNKINFKDAEVTGDQYYADKAVKLGAVKSKEQVAAEAKAEKEAKAESDRLAKEEAEKKAAEDAAKK